ncbi:thermolysin metallopeptidase-like protein [Thermosporothrix hazakensis]|jgi:Zn-dependent metalloprotease|uniref:Neutral metalloproteinase n=2 Tax=Thermosporothrix TaxID=768650 RepID=A0A326U5X6_THEHA|nr:M4 family metallopeptidase [Thermosporothrix hazakensis]PZW29376.1 thermolysin metallopeptidase-like protein [Thermosporothrix hazakensis]BBH85661.1 zinc metalloprotease [Thermosporothrix sp. COM3]GCE45910.1 zinc metalloprotease [Thermosporothrix hazakensis]
MAATTRSILSIIPPYITDAIKKNGSPQQRSRIQEMQELDQRLRTSRANVQRATSTAAQPTPEKARTVQRTIYDTHNTSELPGDSVRTEGSPEVSDPAVNEAYDGLGATYKLYQEVYRRNSIDNKGMALKGVVHYGRSYINAFWDGSYMVFGDGDGDLFNRFTVAVDVIGHELTHGVTEHEAHLIYEAQPGALNESISDVFGILTKQYALKQTAEESDWVVGAGLFTSRVKGQGIRSMKAPGTAYDDPILGKDPQPDHMRNYVQTFDDNGGVHINSGIPNRAFYLTATKIGGYAWEKAGRIWYDTLRDKKLLPYSTFRQFAKRTLENADKLYGKGPEYRAVQEAWNEVGVSI